MKKIILVIAVLAISLFAINHLKEKTIEEGLVELQNTSSLEQKTSNKEIKSQTNNTMYVKEGVHYDTLKTPLSLPPYNGTIISEFFWLGCPHCQNFEADVNRWKSVLNQTKPTIVDKNAVPGSERWNLDARVFYTMKKLNASDKQITDMLSLYKREALLYKTLPTIKRMESLFVEVGFDSKSAMEILNDENALKDELTFSNNEFTKLNAGGVPAFVVNGKYKIRFDNVSSNEQILEIIKYLSNK